jgi:hypothetical protein
MLVSSRSLHRSLMIFVFGGYKNGEKSLASFLIGISSRLLFGCCLGVLNCVAQSQTCLLLLVSWRSFFVSLRCDLPWILHVWGAHSRYALSLALGDSLSLATVQTVVDAEVTYSHRNLYRWLGIRPLKKTVARVCITYLYAMIGFPSLVFV